MKKYFLYVAAALALGSCSSDEFLGENLPVTSGNEGAITFSGFKSNMHRATSTNVGAAAAKLLDYNFSVLGTKTLGTDAPVNVFAHESYNANGIADASLYDVWYGTAAGTTTTNPKSWEYVGSGTQATPERADGTSVFAPTAAQTIKYWDNSADKYNFVAYSATKGGAVSEVTTTGFKFTGNADQLSGLYIADSYEVLNDGSGVGFDSDPVTLTFRAACARVRVGFYETIPGYQITSMTFHSADGTSTDAKLDGKFPGGNNNIVTTVTFNDATALTNGQVTTKHAEVAQANAATVGTFDFGTLTFNPLAETSANATLTAFKNVVPNVLADNIAPMKLEIDFKLTNTTTGEVINVTGATATVPAEYMMWKNNYSYTYLFKISDKVNGSTGSGVEGLYPITFDAQVVEGTEDGRQGTTTTVADYAITTYQDGSVVADGLGINYIAGEVEVRVKDKAGALQSFTTTNLKVYTGFKGTTEADLYLTGAFTGAIEETVTIDTTDSTKAKFTAVTGTNYAIVYTDGNGTNYYKIVLVP